MAILSDHGYPGRGGAIVSGVVTVLGGIITLALPFDSIAVLTLVVGAWLVVIGVVEIIGSFAIRKDAKPLAGALRG